MLEPNLQPLRSELDVTFSKGSSENPGSQQRH